MPAATATHAATPVPWGPVGVVIACIFADALKMMLVFPFLPFMVRDLLGTEAESAVATYAGLLAGAYKIGQFVLAPAFGYFADAFGRRPPMLIAMAIGPVMLVLFATAPTFRLAFVWRLLQGAVSGSVTVGKVYLADVTDASNEARVFSYVGLAMGLGVVVGPTIGGLLARPCVQYPGVALFDPARTPSGRLFSRFPYLLPCLCSVACSLTNLVSSWFLLKESHPEFRRVGGGWRAQRRRAAPRGGRELRATAALDDSDSGGRGTLARVQEPLLPQSMRGGGAPAAAAPVVAGLERADSAASEPLPPQARCGPPPPLSGGGGSSAELLGGGAAVHPAPGVASLPPHRASLRSAARSRTVAAEGPGSAAALAQSEAMRLVRRSLSRTSTQPGLLLQRGESSLDIIDINPAQASDWLRQEGERPTTLPLVAARQLVRGISRLTIAALAGGAEHGGGAAAGAPACALAEDGAAPAKAHQAGGVGADASAADGVPPASAEQNGAAAGAAAARQRWRLFWTLQTIQVLFTLSGNGLAEVLPVRMSAPPKHGGYALSAREIGATQAVGGLALLLVVLCVFFRFVKMVGAVRALHTGLFANALVFGFPLGVDVFVAAHGAPGTPGGPGRRALAVVFALTWAVRAFSLNTVRARARAARLRASARRRRRTARPRPSRQPFRRGTRARRRASRWPPTPRAPRRACARAARPRRTVQLVLRAALEGVPAALDARLWARREPSGLLFGQRPGAGAVRMAVYGRARPGPTAAALPGAGAAVLCAGRRDRAAVERVRVPAPAVAVGASRRARRVLKRQGARGRRE